MSSPSDSSSCASQSAVESFTVDEAIGELSEFAPYDDSCEPLATDEETADYNVSSSRRRRGTTVSPKIFGRCQRMNGMVLSWDVDLYLYFPISTYPLLNRACDERS